MILSVDHLRFSYRGLLPYAPMLLEDISLQINKGEGLALSGANGTGKTTLLKIISGLIKPDSGQINYNGNSVGLYLPNRFFYNSLTLEENLNFFTNLSKTKKTAKLIDHFNLQSLLHQKFGTLSLGEKARGLLSRLFLVPADIYLLDEPLQALDAIYLKKCIDYLREVKEAGKSFLLVSHDFNSINGLVDRTLSLQNGRLL